MNRIFLIDDGPATEENVRRMLRSAVMVWPRELLHAG
jgi:hypothetical protein